MINTGGWRLGRTIAACLCTMLGGMQAVCAADGQERGAYLAQIMDCGGCHTPGALIGQPKLDQPLSGGDVGFSIPGLGVFFPPNLTSDTKTGLGAWSKGDIVRAIREGMRPDGRMLSPAMPWRSYAALTDADAEALASYLKTLPAHARQVPGPFGQDAQVPAPYLSIIAPAAK
jgi:mono/diheme cytochrome c family protein